MMVGIISYGAYIPRYRLNRKTILKAMGWFNAVGLPGEKAVANYDEDSITMAVAAATNCLRGFNREEIDGLYFATTTAPYKEGHNAGIIANALNLRNNIRTADFTSTTKSGTSALLAASEAIKARSIQKALVCVADNRLGKMGSTQEYLFGDGAAAFLVGEEGVIAKIEDSYSLSLNFIDHRRTQKDLFDRSWEDRWIRDEGYLKFIPQLISELLQKCNLSAENITKLIYTCPYAREHADIGKKLGIASEKLQNNLIAEMGDTGSAYALIMLIAALEEAKPNDKLLVANYGSGGDALCFTITENITGMADRKGVKAYLSAKKELDSYEKYTVFRNIVPLEVGIRGEEIAFTQLSTLFRERKNVISLCGSKCKKCGTPQYPAQRICVNPNCETVDQMEEYCFSDKKACLFTYTGDSLAASLNPPAIYGIVDFEGGGRFMFDITDCELDSLKVGMPLQMSFRRKYADESRGVYGYYWKTVPLKEEK